MIQHTTTEVGTQSQDRLARTGPAERNVVGERHACSGKPSPHLGSRSRYRSFYRKSAPVKRHRRTARVTTHFGAGILRYTPSDGRQSYTAADRSWAAQAFAADEDRRLDERATEAAWGTRYEAGWVL